MRRALAIAALVVASLAALAFIANGAASQQVRSSVYSSVNATHVSPNDAVQVTAFGMNGQGTAMDDQSPPPEVGLVTTFPNRQTDGIACFRFDTEEWVAGSLNENCFVPMEQRGQGNESWVRNITVPERFTGTQDPAVPDNFTQTNFQVILLQYEVEFGLITGNVVSSDGELMFYAGPPEATVLSNTAFHEFSGLTSLEWGLFFLIAFLGVLLWARTQDLVVEVLGAMLPVLAGLLLLGFGIDQEFSSIWLGIPAMSAIFMLAGIYMMIRVFTDKLGREEGGGLRG